MMANFMQGELCVLRTYKLSCEQLGGVLGQLVLAKRVFVVFILKLNLE